MDRAGASLALLRQSEAKHEHCGETSSLTSASSLKKRTNLLIFLRTDSIDSSKIIALCIGRAAMMRSRENVSRSPEVSLRSFHRGVIYIKLADSVAGAGDSFRNLELHLSAPTADMFFLRFLFEVREFFCFGRRACHSRSVAGVPKIRARPCATNCSPRSPSFIWTNARNRSALPRAIECERVVTENGSLVPSARTHSLRVPPRLLRGR